MIFTYSTMLILVASLERDRKGQAEMFLGIQWEAPQLEVVAAHLAMEAGRRSEA